MSELTSMANIGKMLAQRMADADIHTADDLVRMGAKEAFLRVKAVYPNACVNHLYALEGAVRGIRWGGLPGDVKKDLKTFYDERF